MNKMKIMDYLRQSAGIEDVEEIEYKSGFLVLRFFYVYDDDELDAARDYADNESSEENSEEEWYDEYYLPYLIDLAVDEVNDDIEELVDSEEINAEYISYELEKDDEGLEFVAVFADEANEFDIDEVLDELGL